MPGKGIGISTIYASAGSPVVFLVSLKAGGQGLNLVSASHVHLLGELTLQPIGSQIAGVQSCILAVQASPYLGNAYQLLCCDQDAPSVHCTGRVQFSTLGHPKSLTPRAEPNTGCHADPWWNLSVEEQAMDRVHRLGQQRPVEVFR